MVKNQNLQKILKYQLIYLNKFWYKINGCNSKRKGVPCSGQVFYES